MNFKYIIILLLLSFSCKEKGNKIKGTMQTETISKNTLKVRDSIIFVSGFDFPVGKPNANKYYNAQKFQENQHLGDDWNGIGGGNTDLGDPIYTIGNGYVNFASDIGGGWGKVIRIIHYFKNGKTVESLYAHCNEILVSKGNYVTKGKKIGTIGTADGNYLAHLHLEIRDKINMPIGEGYSDDITGYLNPTKFIKQNRK